MKSIYSFVLLLFLFSFYAQAIPYESSKIGISAASSEAVDAALEIYKQGGNVVDAAVALNLAMAVTSPYFASLGGGGFAMIKMGEKVEALDFRETAPDALEEASFTKEGVNKEASITGGLAVGVPGIPMGLWEMHKKYGKLPWSSLFSPAIRLAESGFAIHSDFSKRIKENEARLNASGKASLSASNQVLKTGDVWKQPALAKALKFLKYQGVKEFYEGRIAKDIVESVRAAGGVLKLEDLKKYRVQWREPMVESFYSHKVYMMPPPSSGGVVMTTAMKLMEKWQLPDYPAFDAKELHLWAEILSRSFRSRPLLGDPDFYKNPTEKLLSEKYLDRLSKTISMYKTLELKPLEEKDYIEKESSETTHFSIVDEAGNAVSMTITLNGSFGSGIFSDQFRINLNNEMDDFNTKPGQANMFGLVQGSGNLVAGGKRPLSSMSPTIAIDEKDPTKILAVGSPGGPRIISSVLQVLYRHLVNGLDIDEAIQAPRFHHQFIPHKLYYEKNKSFPDAVRILERKGHIMEDSWAGKVYGVSKKGKHIYSAYDQRLPGAAKGY